MSFFTKPRLMCWLLLIGIAAALLLSYMINPKTQRALLYFQRADGSIGTEERYLPQFPVKDLPISLVEEMLLGPADHDFLRFCDPQLLPTRCFVRNDSVYVDLPSQVLTPKVKTPDFHTVYTLFRKNILTNCKSIRGIYLYIDGIPAYSNPAAETSK